MVSVQVSASSLQNLQRGVKYAKDRTSYRHRARRTKNALTAVERSLMKQKRRKTAITLKCALAEAQALIYGLAVQMAERFKSHKPDYFYRLIMQQSHRPISTRKVSRWNAFMSQEIEEHNKGT